MCMCEQDLALNNLEGLICRKTQSSNQIELFNRLLHLKQFTYMQTNAEG